MTLRLLGINIVYVLVEFVKVALVLQPIIKGARARRFSKKPRTRK